MMARIHGIFISKAAHDMVERAWLKNFIHGWLMRAPRPVMLEPVYADEPGRRAAGVRPSRIYAISAAPIALPLSAGAEGT